MPDIYGVGEDKLTHITSYRTPQPIAVDGDLAKPAWRDVPRSPRFVDMVSGEPALYDTRVASRWDAERFYVAYWIEEPQVKATLRERDSFIWNDDDVELLPQKTLFKVWGRSEDDVWAVGLDGTILHRGADGWEPEESPTTQRLIAVMGRDTNEVYAVGGDVTGVVLRWDGSSWIEWTTANEPLSAVWTAPGRALYVGGNRGYLARFGV